MPNYQLCKEKDLYPNLTEKHFDDVEKISQEQIEKIKITINKLGKIVTKWNKNAYLAPFGSLVNGFSLKNLSDVDLTIILEKKQNIHPSEY